MTSPQPSPNSGPPRRFRLSQRDLLILLIALVAGTGTGLLLGSAGVALGHAIIGAFTAFAATLVFVDQILD